MKSRNSTLIFILTASLLLSACIYSASKTSKLSVSTKSTASTNKTIINKTQTPEIQAAQAVPVIAPATKTFKIGDHNNEMKAIQGKLNKFGYNLTADGNFGNATLFAVRDFQVKHKIIVNGVVDEDFLKMLDINPIPSTMYTPKAKSVSTLSPQKTLDTGSNYYEKFINSQDCTSTTNNYIFVNLTKQMVYIFSGSNHNWKMINSFACASGKSSTPTIKGHFTVGIKGNSFTSTGGAVCKYFTQISGNYLFHSVLYNKTGNYIIDSTLGTRISHGCVRLATNNALYIYNNISHGTQIWIR